MLKNFNNKIAKEQVQVFNYSKANPVKTRQVPIQMLLLQTTHFKSRRFYASQILRDNCSFVTIKTYVKNVL